MESTNRYPRPGYRPLRVYAFDPGQGREFNNYMTLQVQYEDLAPGPVGARLAVIDYDATNEVFYEAVDLNHPGVLLGNGLEPSESDPRFHQQMVYAIASETIRRFEFALGRRIRWRKKPGSRREDPFHARLRIFPHAFQQANAFYDARLRAVLFGYFAASEKDFGENYPGQTVYTCLSHDIVAHEMTHALVDGQREFLTDATGPDAAAFHEAFADIVALFQHFTYKDALIETISRTGGLLHRQQLTAIVPQTGDQPAVMSEMGEDNSLIGLARQFGQATSERAALRSAIGTPPNSRDIETVMEPHARGGILVSAIFDAFFWIYIKRTREQMRIAKIRGIGDVTTGLHPELAELLADEATKTAAHFVNICIRALDYLPPVDLQFGEFLRAIITADSDLVFEDPWGYRAAIIKAFRLRGIVPKKVRSFSEEALRWCAPDVTGKIVERCTGLQYNVIDDDDVGEQMQRRDVENAVALHTYAKKNAESLGLDPERPIQVSSFHPIHRISPDNRVIADFVVEFLQMRKEPLNPDVEGGPEITFRGGSTVVFNRRGEVRYVIEKSVKNQSRLEQHRGFAMQGMAQCACSPYVFPDVESQLNFQAVHRGF